MYGWLWRHLPGPWPARTLVSLMLLVAVVALLFTVVFPWAEPRLPFTDVTVTSAPSSSLANMGARILVVDNFDSFVYNLVQYLGQLDASCDVRRNDVVDLTEAARFDGILLSPGPGTPEAAGVCVELIRELGGQLPIFGVCLGLQAIGVAYGASVVRSPELLHGKVSEIFHDGAGVLNGLPSPFTATRYHSLGIDPETVPAELEVTARTAEGVIMAARHRDVDVEGVQFHPESVLTEHGHRMLASWLVRCGDPDAAERAVGLAPVVRQASP